MHERRSSDGSTVTSNSISPLEIGLLVGLGLVGLCGLGGMMLSFVPASEPSQTNVVLAPACLGIVLAGFREVPATIARLQEQFEAETNPAVAKEIEEALDNYRRQQSQLEALSILMRRTELDLDETLAAIAGIYAQVQVLSAKGIDSGKVKRLSAAVEAQANHLNDLLEAMDDVYNEKSDRLIDDDHDANAATAHR